MALKILRPPAISFIVSVVKVLPKKHRITLKAVPTGPFILPKAEIIATLKGHKSSIKVSSGLKQLLRQINWTADQLAPVQTYLKEQLRAARKNPEPLIAMLATALKSGQRLNFTISL